MNLIDKDKLFKTVASLKKYLLVEPHTAKHIEYGFYADDILAAIDKMPVIDPDRHKIEAFIYEQYATAEQITLKNIYQELPNTIRINLPEPHDDCYVLIVPNPDENIAHRDFYLVTPGTPCEYMLGCSVSGNFEAVRIALTNAQKYIEPWDEAQKTISEWYDKGWNNVVEELVQKSAARVAHMRENADKRKKGGL